jgi:Fe-S oxidoreductase
LLIAAKKRGLMTWNPESVETLYGCADCGTCRANCVTDQPLPEAIAAARAEVVDQGVAPERAILVKEKLERWENPFQEASPDSVNGEGELALFVSDEYRFLNPAGLEAAVKLLRALDLDPVLIGGGRNNGYLASSLGFPELASEFARRNLEELASTGADKLIVLTPGDYFSFRQLYSERLGIEFPDGVELQELMQLLADQAEGRKLKLSAANGNGPYAYLDPTHSVRVPDRYQAPRSLLDAVRPKGRLELFWRKERTHPCGNGALQFTNPHLATHLDYSRLDDAMQVGATSLYTEDAGCLNRLKQVAPRFGVQVEGLYELLADQLA